MVTPVVVPLTKFFTVLDCIRCAILGEWFSSQRTIRGGYKDLDDMLTFDLTISHLVSSLVFSSIHNSRYQFKVLSCSHALFLYRSFIWYSQRIFPSRTFSYSHRIFLSHTLCLIFSSHIPMLYHLSYSHLTLSFIFSLTFPSHALSHILSRFLI